MKISCLIIGIDGWEKYTLPLVESIQKYQPDSNIVVVDNASVTPYPKHDYVIRTERLCYSAAINWAKKCSDELYGESDYYIVLSNDVLCTGSFSGMLERDSVTGVELEQDHGLQWLKGWCVSIPSIVWKELKGWDENYKISSWEDVDFSHRVLKSKYYLIHNSAFPFKHLDQMQRFTITPDYWQSEVHNKQYFYNKHFAST